MFLKILLCVLYKAYFVCGLRALWLQPFSVLRLRILGMAKQFIRPAATIQSLATNVNTGTRWWVMKLGDVEPTKNGRGLSQCVKVRIQ